REAGDTHTDVVDAAEARRRIGEDTSGTVKILDQHVCLSEARDHGARATARIEHCHLGWLRIAYGAHRGHPRSTARRLGQHVHDVQGTPHFHDAEHHDHEQGADDRELDRGHTGMCATHYRA